MFYSCIVFVLYWKPLYDLWYFYCLELVTVNKFKIFLLFHKFP